MRQSFEIGLGKVPNDAKGCPPKYPVKTSLAPYIKLPIHTQSQSQTQNQNQSQNQSQNQKHSKKGDSERIQGSGSKDCERQCVRSKRRPHGCPTIQKLRFITLKRTHNTKADSNQSAKSITNVKGSAKSDSHSKYAEELRAEKALIDYSDIKNTFYIDQSENAKRLNQKVRQRIHA